MSLGVGIGSFAEGMRGGYATAKMFDGMKKDKANVKDADSAASKITGEVSTKVGENLENKVDAIGFGISEDISQKINANMGQQMQPNQQQAGPNKKPNLWGGVVASLGNLNGGQNG